MIRPSRAAHSGCCLEDPGPAVAVSTGSIAGGRCEACKMVSDPDLERGGKTSVVARAHYRGGTTSATRRDR